ncbi:metallophosphoesterase family protein [Roseomonas sp. CAU 1739]|uniref:metallophosphoesterase family protein n=1 Tax=Roseomonas sp. CAU 1739 TaxID=3140364 RepID=UPI00325C2DA3
MHLAVLADIHGNILALDAVLADIDRRGVRNILNLGDVVSGPLRPRDCLERILARGIPTVRGNHDRWVAEGSTGGSDAFARDRLDPAQAAWLGALPPALEPAAGVLAFHAQPGDDNAYLMEEVVAGRLLPASAEAVSARLGATAATLLLCGHSHLAGLLRLPDGRVVLNPGSVGCPAYVDPTPPSPHVSEAGSPLARYAIAEIEGGRLLGCEMIALGYDHEGAATQAEAAGRPGWAHALRTGVMPRHA